MTLHNLLFCAHTQCMNYVTNTFLLVSFSVRSKQLLCVVQGQVQKSEQKHKTKSIDEFHNHSPLLTMHAQTTGAKFILPKSAKIYYSTIFKNIREDDILCGRMFTVENSPSNEFITVVHVNNIF